MLFCNVFIFQNFATGFFVAYKKEYCEQIIAKMASGLTFPAACSELGISPIQARNWEREHPEFAEARTLGHWKHRAFFEKLLIHSAVGTRPEIKPKDGEKNPQKSTGVNSQSVQFALSRIHHEHYGAEKHRSSEEAIDETVDSIENLESELEHELRELGFKKSSDTKKIRDSGKNKKN